MPNKYNAKRDKFYNKFEMNLHIEIELGKNLYTISWSNGENE